MHSQIDWSKIPTFIISLDDRPDRRDKQLARIAEIKPKWPFGEIKVLRGFPSRQDKPGAFPLPMNWHGPNGAWGCNLSHRSAIWRAYQLRVPAVVILEDDCYFDNNFYERVQDFIKRVPDDWQQLFFGGEHNYYFGRKPEPVAPGIVRCMEVNMLHCYAVRDTFIGRLMERWRYHGHCDWQGNKLQPTCKVYGCDPWIAGQTADFSDITKTYRGKRLQSGTHGGNYE